MTGRNAVRFALGWAVSTIPGTALAQLPNSSTRSVGMGEGYTASARGYEAIAWNPALLAMPGKPKFSVNIMQLGFRTGSNAFGLGDFNRYRGKILTSADKTDLLDRVQATPEGLLAVNTSTGVTAFALTVGSFGLSASASGQAEGDVTSDAVELALFGNVTRRGPGQSYTAQGSGVSGWGTGTVALAYGLRLPMPIGALAVGATLKVNRGIIALRGADLGTSLQSNPAFDATLGYHFLVSDLDSAGYNNGRGFGLDLGGAYQLRSGLKLGLVLENFLNTQSWTPDHLVYYRKIFRLQQTGDQLVDATIADIDRAPYNANDPLEKALRDSMQTGGTFPARVRAGVNIDLGLFTVAGGAVIRARKALDFNAAQQVSAGVEMRAISLLPLRAGISSDLAGGFTFSGGMGLKLGPFRLDAAVADTPSGKHRGFQAALGMSILP
jgi:hypothetical protein